MSARHSEFLVFQSNRTGNTILDFSSAKLPDEKNGTFHSQAILVCFPNLLKIRGSFHNRSRQNHDFSIHHRYINRNTPANSHFFSTSLQQDDFAIHSLGCEEP